MIYVALQSAAALTVLETLWLVDNKRWLEENIGACAVCVDACTGARADAALPTAADFASVQATLLSEARASWLHRMRTHLAFYSAVA